MAIIINPHSNAGTNPVIFFKRNALIASRINVKKMLADSIRISLKTKENYFLLISKMTALSRILEMGVVTLNDPRVAC